LQQCKGKELRPGKGVGGGGRGGADPSGPHLRPATPPKPAWAREGARQEVSGRVCVWVEEQDAALLA